ncbi:MAG TPA: hypothetical protein VKE22_24015 [Haliangiales bacterium]|nr:hypothetical protein [Haliangiales bacterium]
MRAAWLLLLVGCATQIREARAIQPNPVRELGSPDTLPASVPLYVFTRDSTTYQHPLKSSDPRRAALQESDVDYSQGIPRYWQLRNAARFVVVNRDRVRFHVAVVNRDERNAATKDWKVWLEDDTGRKLEPSARESAQMDRLVLPWSMYWDFRTNLWLKQRELPGWDAYQGRADYVFSAPDLMTPERKSLTLVMEHGGVQMRFAWTFDEGNVVEVEHYGRSKVDNEIGTMIAPGPDSQVAQTWYEGEEP